VIVATLSDVDDNGTRTTHVTLTEGHIVPTANLLTGLLKCVERGWDAAPPAAFEALVCCSSVAEDGEGKVTLRQREILLDQLSAEANPAWVSGILSVVVAHCSLAAASALLPRIENLVGKCSAANLLTLRAFVPRAFRSLAVESVPDNLRPLFLFLCHQLQPSSSYAKSSLTHATDSQLLFHLLPFVRFPSCHHFLELVFFCG
jgi:hypothetical protein